MTGDHANYDRRLSDLERGHQDMSKSINDMRSDQRVAKIQQQHVDKRFDKLDSNVSKLIWLVIASIGGGVMSFVLKGGLNVVS